MSQLTWNGRRIEDAAPGARRRVLTYAVEGEDRLVSLAKMGRLDAFETLVRRYHAPVYRIALRLLRHVGDAEDATQNAFFDAWRALPGFQGRSAFSTWLYRILVNRCSKARRAGLPTQPLAETQEARAARPDDLVERAEQFAALTRAIAALPVEQRVPLVLREFEGLAYAQIADALGISVGAVKGRLHRARLTLVEVMRPWV